MKKLGVVIAALLAVGGAAWLGATWYVGQETEKIVRAQIEQANKNSAAQGISQELVSYERSLMGAQAVTRLLVKEPLMSQWLNNAQFTHKIQHGPLLLTSGGGLGVSHWETRLDTASLPAESKAFVEKAFGGKEAFVADTRIGFDKVMHSTMSLNPMDVSLDDNGAKLKFAGATLTADIAAEQNAGPFSLKADAFEVRDANTTFTIPSVEAEGKVGPIAGGLESFNLKAPSISILAAGKTEPVKLDVSAQSTTSEQNGSIQGNGSFQIANIQGAPEIQIKQADLKVDYAGFKLEGLKEIQALQAKMQSLQEQMQVDEAATELPEGQKQQQQIAQELQQATEQLLDIVLNKVLQPGQSKLRYDLSLTLDKGKVSGLADLTYAGSDKPLTLNDLMLYGPQDWGRLVKGSLNLTADKAAVPEDMGMLLASPLEQKAIVEVNNQYKLDLKLLGDSAELNGEPIQFADLPAKFFPQMPSMPQNAASDLGIPADLMKQIEEQGMTPEIMQQLEESDDVPKETLEMLKQLQQMNGQTPQ
ncbi:MAG: DUF945 family protein [Thiothrix sp.]|nr:MAG: DUF945 family protein [Thiothrix sp.]